MTSVLVQPGLAFVSSGSKISTTAKTTIYTQAEGYSSAANLRVTNTTASPVTLDLFWYDASETTEYKILSAKSVTANTAEDVGLSGLGLAKNDEIRATAGTADALECVLTVAETPGRVAG